MPAVPRDILLGHQEVIAPYWNIWCEYTTHVFLIDLTLAWMVSELLLDFSTTCVLAFSVNLLCQYKEDFLEWSFTQSCAISGTACTNLKLTDHFKASRHFLLFNLGQLVAPFQQNSNYSAVITHLTFSVIT